MSEQASYESNFLNNLNSLISEIYDTLVELYEGGYEVIDPKIVLAGKTALKNFQNQEILQGFCLRYYQNYKLIRSAYLQKDRNFLIKNADLFFGELPEDIVNSFSELLGKRIGDGYLISEDDQLMIWDYVYALTLNGLRWDQKMGGYASVKGYSIEDDIEWWLQHGN